MDYNTALERILSLADFERPKKDPNRSEYHLHRIELMLEKMGRPHLSAPTVHVAGSKGKGSTAALITSLLSAQGYKTGLYTSPHLHTFRERIRVDSSIVTEEGFSRLVEELWPVVQWVAEEGGYGEPTTFELLTCMAFVYFQQSKTDFQVIEVGMGGRLDTTNIVDPEVCVLTSISLDHTEVLGDTLERIAMEKAGIIKPGATVVVAPQPPEVMRIFQGVSEEKGAQLLAVSEEMSWHRESHNFEGQSFSVSEAGSSFRFWVPLLGEHQLENACTALAAVEALKNRGHTISEESFDRGFREVQWPGRLEVLRHNGQTIVVDGAHNPYSMNRLVEALSDYFKFDDVIVLFGSLDRHNVDGMVQELATLSPRIIAVRSRHPRSMSSEAIAQAFSQGGVQTVYESDDISRATNYAVDMAQRGDLILGTGSLFVAAEIIETIRGKEPELYPSLDSSSSRPVSTA